MEKLSKEIKLQLGYIIKEERQFQYRKSNEDVNPYSKINFCKGICHHHTLTKLENDYIQDDLIYHALLKKLNLSFNVSIQEHEYNFRLIEDFLQRLLIAIEYIDDDVINNLKQDLLNIDFSQDCISVVYVKLIDMVYNLQLGKNIDKKFLKLDMYKDLYQGIYSAIYYHSLGLYHLNNLEIETAENYIFIAKNLYEKYNVSKGIINSTIMTLYMIKKEFFKLINLSLEMEKYYVEHNNNNRLLHVYSYLSEYYLLINSNKLALEYHIKTMRTIKKGKSLERFKYVIEYNWALHLIENYFFISAYEHLQDALRHCPSFKKITTVNVLLFTMIKLQKPENEITDIINNNIQFLDDTTEYEITIFKYFLYKYNKNIYYRKYAFNKLIPLLKEHPSRIDYLLIVYQDLYE